MKKVFLCLAIALIAVVAFAACNSEPAAEAANDTRPTADREGHPITLPTEINRVVTLGPSTAEILIALGLGDRIIAVDSFSADVAGLPAGVVKPFGIMDPDPEYIISLMPDVVFVAGIARSADSPFAAMEQVGITLIHKPSSDSIAGIMEDIRFIAAVMGVEEAGESIISRMQAELDEIAQIAAGITEARTVYFEVSPAPWMFSVGAGTFINEMIELLGAVNIFADQEGWPMVSDEQLLVLNPDVILTTTDFLDDPIAEIMERPGFDVITAVQNGDVFQIDTASSNRPTHNITSALREMAVAIYPEYFR